MTDIELKLWLADQLPEEIGEDFGFYWKGYGRKKVNNREWYRITALVAAKLDKEKKEEVFNALCRIVSEDYRGEYAPISPVVQACFAPWQQRTRALMEVLK